MIKFLESFEYFSEQLCNLVRTRNLFQERLRKIISIFFRTRIIVRRSLWIFKKRPRRRKTNFTGRRKSPNSGSSPAGTSSPSSRTMAEGSAAWSMHRGLPTLKELDFSVDYIIYVVTVYRSKLRSNGAAQTFRPLSPLPSPPCSQGFRSLVSIGLVLFTIDHPPTLVATPL